MRTQYGHGRTALAVIDGGAPADQALRLKRFREQHPEAEIILCGPWQAAIPESDGERIIVRWELRDLLDALDARYAPVTDDTRTAGSPTDRAQGSADLDVES